MKKLLIKFLCIIFAAAVLSACTAGSNNGGGNNPLFAYIGNFNFANPVGSLTQCTVNQSNGNFTNCNTITPQTAAGVNTLLNPTGMTMNFFNGVPYLYINSFGNPNGTGGANTKCQLNQSTGAISNCTTVAPLATNNFDWPIGVKINRINNNDYAYIPNYGSQSGNTPPVLADTYTKCNVDSASGTLSNCARIALPGILFTPEDIAIFQAANGPVVYIPNQKPMLPGQNSSYVQCGIKPTDGTLINCINFIPAAPGILTQPRGVAINNGFIYFVNSAANGNNTLINSGYTQCTITPANGNLTNCTTTNLPGILNSPTGIIIKDVGNSRYAYIANEDGKTYTQCNVNLTDGTLSGCTNPTAGGFFPTTTAVTYIAFSR